MSQGRSSRQWAGGVELRGGWGTVVLEIRFQWNSWPTQGRSSRSREKAGGHVPQYIEPRSSATWSVELPGPLPAATYCSLTGYTDYGRGLVWEIMSTCLSIPFWSPGQSYLDSGKLVGECSLWSKLLPQTELMIFTQNLILLDEIMEVERRLA